MSTVSMRGWFSGSGSQKNGPQLGSRELRQGGSLAGELVAALVGGWAVVEVGVSVVVEDVVDDDDDVEVKSSAVVVAATTSSSRRSPAARKPMSRTSAATAASPSRRCAVLRLRRSLSSRIESRRSSALMCWVRGWPWESGLTMGQLRERCNEPDGRPHLRPVAPAVHSVPPSRLRCDPSLRSARHTQIGGCRRVPHGAIGTPPRPPRGCGLCVVCAWSAGSCGQRAYTLTSEERWSGGGDLNPRPLRPERSALPNCATTRWNGRAYPAAQVTCEVVLP